MADEYLSCYRQFFEKIAKEIEPLNDPLPIRPASYNLTSEELVGELIESSFQYLSQNCCPPSLLVPLTRIVVDEFLQEARKQHQHVYQPLKLMQQVTRKVNEVCLRYTDNEKLSSLPAPSQETLVSAHAIKHVRRRMEDRHISLPSFNTLHNIPGEAGYYAIFDGHNGSDAASFSVSHLHQFLAESKFYPHDPVNAFKDAYAKTEACFMSKDLRSGTTVVAILHQKTEKRLIVSWLGDSQAILVGQGNSLQLVNPHKPERPDESKRIQELGGFVISVDGLHRVNGQLAVSRAIGDVQYKPYVSAEPDVCTWDLDGGEDFIVIGCDGLWDVCEPREVLDTVYFQVRKQPDQIQTVSHHLVDLAKENGSTDNITVVVVFLTNPTDIAKRQPEQTGQWPKHNNQNYFIMDSNIDHSEKNPFQAGILDASLNGVFRTNGGYKDTNDGLDDYLGPETDVDTVDDILLSPSKTQTDNTNNPFGNSWPKQDNFDNFNDGFNSLTFNEVNQNILSSVKPPVDLLNHTDTIMEEDENPTAQETLLDFINDKKEDIINEKIKQEQENILNVENNEVQNLEMKDVLTPDQTENKIPDLEKDLNAQNEIINAANLDNIINVSGTNFDEIEKSFTNWNENDNTVISNPNDNSVNSANLDESGITVNSANVDNSKEEEIKADLVNSFETPQPQQVDDFVVYCSGEPAPEKNPFELSNDLVGITHTVEEIESNSTPDAAFNPFADGGGDYVNHSSESENLQVKFSNHEEDLASNDTVEAELVNALQDLAVDSETSEVSPSVPFPPGDRDEKFTACDGDLVVESDSEEDEWNYIKGSAEQLDKPKELVCSEQSLDSQNMTSPLNPDAAEFVPVSPTPALPGEEEEYLNQTPLKSIPRGLTDIVASSPNWPNMENVVLPAEDTFLKEVKSRPSGLFDSAGDQFGDDIEQDIKPLEPDFVAVTGIDLATDMTSSFIDTSTITDNTSCNATQEIKDFSIPESTLNVQAPEFTLNVEETLSIQEPVVEMEKPEELIPVSPTPQNEIKEAPVVEQQLPTLELVNDQPPIGLEQSPIVETPVSTLVEAPTSPSVLSPSSEATQPISQVETLPSPTPLEVDKIAKPTEAIISAVEQSAVTENTTEPSVAAEAGVVAATAAVAVTAAAVATAVGDKKDAKKATTKPIPGKTTKAAPSKSAASTTLTSKPAVKKAPISTVTKSTTAPPKPAPAATRTAVTARASPVTKTTAATAPSPRPSSAAKPRVTLDTTKTTTTRTSPSTTKSTATRTITATSAAAAPKPKPKVPSNIVEKKSPVPINGTAAAKPAPIKRPEVKKTTPTTATTAAPRTALTSRPATAPARPTTATSRTTPTLTNGTTAKKTTPTTATTARTAPTVRKTTPTTARPASAVASKTTAGKTNGVANGRVANSTTVKKTTTTTTGNTKTAVIKCKTSVTESKTESKTNEQVANETNEKREEINVVVINGV